MAKIRVRRDLFVHPRESHFVMIASLVYRHRPLLNIVDKKPALATGAWVAPSAAVIGNVSLGSGSSVWYNSIVKGAAHAAFAGLWAVSVTHLLVMVYPRVLLIMGCCFACR